MLGLISAVIQGLMILRLFGPSPFPQEGKPLEQRKEAVQVEKLVKPAEQPRPQEVVQVPAGQSSGGIMPISKTTSFPDPDMLDKITAHVFDAINQSDIVARKQYTDDLNQLRADLGKRENQLDILLKAELNRLRIEFDKKGEKLRKDAMIYSAVGALGITAAFQMSQVLWHYVERRQYEPLQRLLKYFQIPVPYFKKWLADTANRLKQFNKKPLPEEQERIEMITLCVDTLLRTEKNSTQIDLVFTKPKIAEIARSIGGLCDHDIKEIFSAVKAQLLIKKELTGELIDTVVSDYRAKL